MNTGIAILDKFLAANQDDRSSFLSEAFSLPPEEQTYGRVLVLAKKYGAGKPAEAAEDFFKKKREHYNLLKLEREDRQLNQQEQAFSEMFAPPAQYEGLPEDFEMPEISADMEAPPFFMAAGPTGKLIAPQEERMSEAPVEEIPIRGLTTKRAPSILSNLPADVQAAIKAEMLGMSSPTFGRFVMPQKTDTTLTETELARDAIFNPDPDVREKSKQSLMLLKQSAEKPLDLGDVTERIALRDYNDRYANLNQPQRADVSRKAQEELDQRAQLSAYARTTGQIEAQRDQPLGVKAGLYMDENGNFADPQMTENEAIKKGMVPVTQSKIDSAKFAKGSLNYLKSYLHLIPKLLVKKGDSDLEDAARIKGNQIVLMGKRLAGDPDAQRLDALAAYIVELAKATGDSGNIAVAERLITLSALPTTADSQESAIAKLRQAEDIMLGHIKSTGIPYNGRLFPKDKKEEALSPDEFIELLKKEKKSRKKRKEVK